MSGGTVEGWGSTSAQWDDAGFDQLVTGEAVALELPPASVGLRLLSGLIDVAAQLVLLVVLLVVVAFVAPDAALAQAFSVVAVVLCVVLGPATVETLTSGRSLGKVSLGLRAVRDDAGPISFHHAFVRHLLSLVEIWTLGGVPALLAAATSRQGKRLGDMVAGTYVVRDRYRLTLPPPPQMPPALAGWAARADLGPMPPGLLLAVRQLLSRTHTLTPQARERLLARAVAEVSRRVAPPPPPGTAPEAFLAAVSAERRTRDARRLAREAQLRERLTHRAAGG